MNTPIYNFQSRPIVSQHAGLTVTRVGPNLGAEITGVDLREPITDEVRDAIEDALAENQLIILRNQGQTLLEAHVSQLGQVLQAKSLLGWDLATD